MVVAPTIQPLVYATSASGTVGAIPICDVPTKPTTRPDVKLPNRLPETIQMEAVSVAKQARKYRRFPHSTRHYMTVVTTMPEGKDHIMADHMMWCQGPGSGRGVKSN